ncbi:hypothetical protein CDAR_183781 [Caerostris darwini]|uniref:Uncharacterized protein n=1 Tax=Caerostris darwini TaxID=1538125 RepID=A0AAV4TXM8_9ARAC|nr:hypothetical protein CDAR_183781 [Caerostris darwini]
MIFEFVSRNRCRPKEVFGLNIFHLRINKLLLLWGPLFLPEKDIRKGMRWETFIKFVLSSSRQEITFLISKEAFVKLNRQIMPIPNLFFLGTAQ